MNEQQVKISKNTLVIADSKNPVALAGIMGGAESAVSDGTKNILLESAYFDPIQIASRARQYGLHTDSSHRFERGVDPELAPIEIPLANRYVLRMQATYTFIDWIASKLGDVLQGSVWQDFASPWQTIDSVFGERYKNKVKNSR